VKGVLILVALVGITASAAAATVSRTPAVLGAAPATMTICHRTASTANPWQRIIVSSRAVSNPSSSAGRTLYGHLRHIGDVVIVGTASCSSTVTSTAPARSSSASTKVTICHKTGSAANPYRRTTISSRAVTNPQSQSGSVLRGHMRHAGDILLPGTNACPAGGAAVQLTATLQPVPVATGRGSATFTIRVGQGQLCFTLTAMGLTDITAAHIHRQSTSAIVVPLTTPTAGNSSGCVTAGKDLLREIVSSPGAFYVNVHTAAYPDGQLRGNLTR
jgi:CHRD domain-containing protein